MVTDWTAEIVGVILVILFFGFMYWRRRHIPSGWIIGPIVKGRNYSVGLPLRPEATANGWKVRLKPGNELDAIDRDVNGLPPGGTVRFFLGVDNPGAIIAPSKYPAEPAVVGLYIQRRGDKWDSEGEGEFFRWYSAPTIDLMAGSGGFEIRLVPEAWFAIEGTPGADVPEKFIRALQNAARIGLTFGAPGGRSHGIVTNGPVEFELQAWEITP